MPHDKNGIELKLGDIVTIQGKVTNLGLQAHYCNCTVELTEKMPVDADMRPSLAQVITTSNLNTRQVVKVTNPDEKRDAEKKP